MDSPKKLYMVRRAECIISGRVQGVMFRDFVKRSAKKFGVLGTVENQQNGTVYVVAEADEKILKEFIKELYRKPFISRMVARVDGISEEWKEATGEFKSFDIIY